MASRTMLPPPVVKSCGCGSRLVEEIVDGISARYTCNGCNALLADLILGAEP